MNQYGLAYDKNRNNFFLIARDSHALDVESQMRLYAYYSNHDKLYLVDKSTFNAIDNIQLNAITGVVTMLDDWFYSVGFVVSD